MLKNRTLNTSALEGYLNTINWATNCSDVLSNLILIWFWYFIYHVSASIKFQINCITWFLFKNLHCYYILLQNYSEMEIRAKTININQFYLFELLRFTCRMFVLVRRYVDIQHRRPITLRYIVAINGWLHKLLFYEDNTNNTTHSLN